MVKRHVDQKLISQIVFSRPLFFHDNCFLIILFTIGFSKCVEKGEVVKLFDCRGKKVDYGFVSV